MRRSYQPSTLKDRLTGALADARHGQEERPTREWLTYFPVNQR